MLVVGLTGGIGAGKSTVSALLANHGAHIVDVDALGREIIAADGIIVEAVLERFGKSLQLPDNSIDRAALASIVFDDPDKLAALNQISHPAINELIDKRLDEYLQSQSETQLARPGVQQARPGVQQARPGVQQARPAVQLAVLDMAVLVESNLGRDNKHRYEVVATVEAPHDVRLERLRQRGMNEKDALARMAAQATDEQRTDLADFVIGNGGSLQELESVVQQLWERLVALSIARAC